MHEKSWMNTYEQFLVEKLCNWCQKRKNKGNQFSFISFYFYQSKIFVFNCQSCKYGQLSHSYIKCDLGNPNFSSTTIVIPLFSWQTSGVHIFKLRLRGYSYTPQEPTSSHIHTYSYSYLQEVVIGGFLNLLFDFTREYCKLVKFLIRIKRSHLG